MNGIPAIVTDAVRAGPLLAGMSRRTVPLPVPLRPAVIVTQSALVVVVHAQPLVAVTSIETVSGPRPAW